MKANKHLMLVVVCMNFILIKFLKDEFAGIWTYLFYTTLFASTVYIIYYLARVAVDLKNISIKRNKSN